jgi:hypothetical protein
MIYHSPQSPGYTAWVGAWTMPDGSLMTAFNQATGPVDPSQRTLMPEAALERDFNLTEDPGRSPPYTYLDPHRDFWGLDQSVVYLRSTDGGRRWQVWRRDPFQALAPQAYTPQPDIALPDGTLIRRVSGEDLPNVPAIPHEALLQTLTFNRTDSSGQSASWSLPRAVLHDSSICSYQITRIHQLQDNRLIATGGVVPYKQGKSGPCAADPSGYLLLVSASASAAEHGRWSLGMPYIAPVFPDEWDVAELPNGNLLALMRTQIDGKPSRAEAVLRRSGSGWVMGVPHALPDIAAMQPSGHPELLATHEGVVISFATTGVAYTADGGGTWRPLSFRAQPSTFSYQTDYYPRAVQAADGTIYVFSSHGFDIPYGAFDESIVMDRFHLVIPGRPATAPAATQPATPRTATPSPENAGGVTASRALLSGIAQGRPQLRFTITTGAGSSPVETIKIGPPSDLRFAGSARVLADGISLKNPRGRPVSFTSQVSKGRLTVTLATGADALDVTIGAPAISASQSLVNSVQHGYGGAIDVVVKTTDLGGNLTKLALSVKPS